MLRKRAKCGVIAGAFTLLTSGPVWPQADGESVADLDPGIRNRTETIVTTQKREQTLQEVPLSISVVQGDIIDRLGVYRFEDIQALIPNLHIDEGLASPVIHMRGLGSGAANFAFEQSVGMFVDGVYSGRSHLFEVPLFDVERVEVVRGPQGALFGKNTIAGAISITTRRPSDEFEAFFKAGYEIEREGYDFEASISGPISDRVRFRLAAKVWKEGGFVHNFFTGNDEPEEDGYLIRGSAEFDVTDNFQIFVKVEGGEVNTDGGWFQIHEFGTAPLSGLFQLLDPNAEDDLDGFRSAATGLDPEFNDTDTFNATMIMDWNIGDHTITSITAYGEFDYLKNVEFTGTSLMLAQSTIPEDYYQFSQELRLVSPSGKTIEYVVGLLYIKDHLKTGQNTNLRQFGPFTGERFGRHEQDGETFSAFASATWNISETLRLTGGLRYIHEIKKARTSQVVTPPYFPGTFDFDRTGNRKEDHAVPSVNLQYDLTDEVTTYFTYARGTKAGGFLSNDGALEARRRAGRDDYEYEDEKAENFEIGVKASLFDNRVALNIAAFITNFDNLQVSTFDGVGFVTANAAKARIKGFELEGTFVLHESLTLIGGLAYLDAKYRDFPGGQCLFDATEADGCDPVTRTQNLAGVRLTRAPEWEGTLTLDWVQPISNWLTLTAQFNLNYKGMFYHQPDLDPFDAQDGYVKINARVGFQSADEMWEVAVVGRNLTDKITTASSFDTPFFGGGSHVAMIAPRRTIMIEASWRL